MFEQVAAATAAPAAPDRSVIRRHGIILFAVGFLVLFLELSCIRWLAARVIFLQFFTNVVLIASFLGMSCGCLASRRRQNWLNYYPMIALCTVVVALVMAASYRVWSGLAVNIGGQNSPQEVFFGTEYRDRDVAQFVVPIEAIAALFFVLVALMFVGLGQVLGRAFDAYPSRVRGYTLNIGGSLAGIAAFSALSFVHAPPVVWFLISGAGIAYLLYREGWLNGPRVMALVGVAALIGFPSSSLRREAEVIRWSPYYMVDHDIASGAIGVNTIAHQNMIPFKSAGSSYSLIHLLQQHSGGSPFKDLLIIGAGSGNDIAHALKFGAQRIDAVEIDPVIQDIGRRYHPDHPYQDSRVIPHLDDGRHFLRTTDRKYDLVVYALVDSLILHSSYANIRLESYLFTKEAFEDVRRVLKPDGVFVMYNYFRQGWIVERIAGMVESTFGCKPTVLSLPHQEKLSDAALDGFTMIIGGCNSHIPDAFAKHPNFWLDSVPERNLNLDGFSLNPDSVAPDSRGELQWISPTLVTLHDNILSISDDWPFLYLHGRVIPDFTIRSMVVMGILGLGMVYLFLPRGRIRLDNRMFFLGAAFMLLETKSVAQMALLFGSTWLVNSGVFATILILILLANLYVLAVQRVDLRWHYLALIICLVVGATVPLDVFLTGNVLWRYVIPCVVALSPVFFAGVIFATSFQKAAEPQFALGSNIAGSVVGGLAESFSMLLGFQHLLLIALLFYVLSAWSPQPRMALAPR